MLLVWKEIEVNTDTVFKILNVKFNSCAVVMISFININFFHCDQHLVISAEG